MNMLGKQSPSEIRTAIYPEIQDDELVNPFAADHPSATGATSYWMGSALSVENQRVLWVEPSAFFCREIPGSTTGINPIVLMPENIFVGVPNMQPERISGCIRFVCRFSAQIPPRRVADEDAIEALVDKPVKLTI